MRHGCCCSRKRYTPTTILELYEVMFVHAMYSSFLGWKGSVGSARGTQYGSRRPMHTQPLWWSACIRYVPGGAWDAPTGRLTAPCKFCESCKSEISLQKSAAAEQRPQRVRPISQLCLQHGFASRPHATALRRDVLTCRLGAGSHSSSRLLVSAAHTLHCSVEMWSSQTCRVPRTQPLPYA